MAARLFVGNLSYSTMDDQLRQAFSQFGEVSSAVVILDRMTGRSRGFGFVEYASDADAKKATEAMNGQLLDGRAIVVNEARERAGGGGGGGGGRGFGGGGRGGGGGGGGGGRGGDRGGRGDRRERWLSTDEKNRTTDESLADRGALAVLWRTSPPLDEDEPDGSGDGDHQRRGEHRRR